MIKFEVNNKATKSMCDESDSWQQKSNEKIFKSVQNVGVVEYVYDGDHVNANIHSNALLGAVNKCFDKHRELILSPDVIWFAISQGLSNHIDQNAESLRHHFVSHEGKKLIQIRRDEFVKGGPNNWLGVFPEFSDKLKEDIGEKRDLLVPTFSTTDYLAKCMHELSLMNSMKNYFSYTVMSCCGIPYVTLDGETKDWEDILNRIQSFREFDLNWWIDPLSKVMEKFVDASKGNVDVEFWDRMFKRRYGSGGNFFGGWIKTLFPYITKDNYNTKITQMVMNSVNNEDMISTGDITPSMSHVPFVWDYYGEPSDMSFVGGLMSCIEDPTTFSLKPNFGFGVCYKK